MRYPRRAAIALLLLSTACPGRPPAPVSEARPSCIALEEAKKDVAAGRLRRALERLEPYAQYCDTDSAKRLRAEVLVDLARYEDARLLVGETPELLRRTAPATAEQIARSRALSREALDAPPERAAKLFLEAWEADHPNGLALVRAGLLQRSAGRALFERGTAELERETGRRAHAGRRAGLICAGHFSNGLTVSWLPDSRHAIVNCTDGSAIIDAMTLERVANHDGRGIDESRLPRLRFTNEEADITDREIACSADVAKRISLDATNGILGWSPEGGRRARTYVLANVFRASEKEQRTTPTDPRFPVPAAWSVHCLRGSNPKLVYVRGEWNDNPNLTPMHVTGVFDLDAGRFTAFAAGDEMHTLDDGRVVIRGRGPEGVTVLDTRGAVSTREPTRGADLSYDGSKLVFVKEEGGDEMFRPVWPYVRQAPGAPEKYLGDVGRMGSTEPTAAKWRRTGLLEATHCAELGTMPSGDRDCARPGVRIEGVDYGTSDEVACDRVADGDDRDAPLRVTCLDPRGPVAVTPGPTSSSAASAHTCCRLGRVHTCWSSYASTRPRMGIERRTRGRER